jgi:hypothetical protein
MQLLDDHLFGLYAADTISAEDAFEHCRNPGSFQDRLERHARGERGDERDDEPPTQPAPVPRPSTPPHRGGHA